MKGFGAQEGGFEDKLDFGGIVQHRVGVGQSDRVVLGINGLLGEEGLGFGDLAAVGIFLKQEFEVGDAVFGHAVMDPGAAQPDEGFRAKIFGLEAPGKDGEEARLLVLGQGLGFGPGQAGGEGEALVSEGLVIAGAQFLGVIVGSAQIHGGQVGEHEVEAFPSGGVAVAFDHLPVERASLVGASDLAQGPAGVVSGIDDIAVVGHVLDVLDIVSGHGAVVALLGESLVDARDLGEGHVVEGPGGGGQREVVGLLGSIEFR